MKSTCFRSMALAFASSVALAQNVTFEVASVKPQTEVLCCMSHAGARFYEPAAFLRSVIAFAHDVTSIRVVGGPEWVDAERWDIDAKPAVPSTTQEMRPMVRRLLGDRFKLVVRVEVREMPVYELRLSRQDGKLGPNVKPAADCISIGNRSKQERQQMAGKVCGPGNPRLGVGSVSQRFLGVPFSVLATELESLLKRPVRDVTGVGGLFDFDLTYAPETRQPFPTPTQVARRPDAPSLLTALREQLGLDLEASRGPVDVIVIDSVTRPTPN